MPGEKELVESETPKIGDSKKAAKKDAKKAEKQAKRAERKESSREQKPAAEEGRTLIVK